MNQIVENSDSQRKRKVIKATHLGLSGYPYQAARVLSGYDVTAREIAEAVFVAVEKEPDDALAQKKLLQMSLVDIIADRSESHEHGGRADILTENGAKISEKRRKIFNAAIVKRRAYSEALVKVRGLSGDELSTVFNDVVKDNSLGMTSSVNMFLATALSFTGNLMGLRDDFKRAVIEDVTIDAFEENIETKGISRFLNIAPEV